MNPRRLTTLLVSASVIAAIVVALLIVIPRLISVTETLGHVLP